MKGNQISQSPTDNGIMDIKADSVEVQRRKIKLASLFRTSLLKLHYCSLINSVFSFYRLCALWQGSVGGAWDSEIICSVRWGGLWYVGGSTPAENAVGWSCVWLHRLISAITAQLDWPDILAGFVSGIIQSTKASYRQLLLQQSFSILGVTVWRAASCLNSRELGKLMQTATKAFFPFWGAAGNLSGCLCVLSSAAAAIY